LHIGVFLQDLPVLLCSLALLELPPMGSHLVPWRLLLSHSQGSGSIRTRSLLLPFLTLLRVSNSVA